MLLHGYHTMNSVVFPLQAQYCDRLLSTLHINVPDEVTNLTVMIRKVGVGRPCCHLGAKN